MSSFLSQSIDFARHNDQVKAVWDAYHRREPVRVPVRVRGSIRNLFGNPEINATGWTFEDFFTKPQAQIDCQLAYQKWVRYNLICDLQMGPPEDAWHVGIDFQNSYDAGWFGCPLVYDGNAVPDTLPILQEDKNRLYELEDPDPMHGNLFSRVMEFFDAMHETCPRLEFEGLPVKPPVTVPGENMDGPFDAAYKLRGATEVCIDMLEDPDYYHELMRYITRNLMRRMKALREWRWSRVPDSADKGQFKRPGWGFADDAIAMLSVEMYREFVMPYHQQFLHEFSDGGRVSVHLCGDVQRFFPLLRDELNVYSFDTGFPLDFARFRQEMGPDVQISGGPTVMLLKNGTPDQIRAEVRRICESGIMDGGRFILREANNMAPCTPVENVAAMYEAGREYGVYER